MSTRPSLQVVLRIFISVGKTIRKYTYMSYSWLGYAFDFEQTLSEKLLAGFKSLTYCFRVVTQPLLNRK